MKRESGRDKFQLSTHPLGYVSLLGGAFALIVFALFWSCHFTPLASVPFCAVQLSQPWATVVTGVLVLLGAILTYLSTERSREITRSELLLAQSEAERNHSRATESDLNSRFAVAIENLGNERNYTVKLGGAYSLFALAEEWSAFSDVRSSEEVIKQRAQVCVDVLCAYIRSNTHKRIESSQASEEIGLRVKIVEMLLSTQQFKHTHKTLSPLLNARLDLSGADLTGVSFVDMKNSTANLMNTVLHGTDFSGSAWPMGSFAKAKLNGANFDFCDLGGACLEGADLEGGFFEMTSFNSTHLDDAHLCGADLSLVRDLSSEQVESAHCWDESTRFPEGIHPSETEKTH